MKLNDNARIITDDDIIMSDRGTTLSDVLSSQLDEISKLKSNVKWIYKYGGVGGSGSGGGGGPTQPFSIFATLDGLQLKDLLITLKGEGLYTLNVKINNSGGVPFNVKYSYYTKSYTGTDIKQEQSAILSIENNYTLNVLLNLNTNATLLVTATDGNDTLLVSCTYVTSAYVFDVSLVDDNGEILPEEIFIENALKKGINFKVSYVISIPASIKYTYTFLNEELVNTIEDKLGSLLFPIDKSLFIMENAGFYSPKIKFDVIPEGQELVTIEKSKNFTLIPELLYIYVNPEIGSIYKLELTENYYKYTPGYITFYYRVYEGVSLNRSYNCIFKLNGNIISQQSILERLQYTLKIFTIKSGLNALEVNVSRQTEFNQTYYFYVLEVQESIDWFENPINWTSYYYRIFETTDNLKLYLNKLYIEQTLNSPKISLSGFTPPKITASSLLNTHIAIGLLYNEINSENPVIFLFYNTLVGSSPVIVINQNKITMSGQELEFYIRKLNDVNATDTRLYHLLQIYSQYVKKILNEYYYRISLYIDGVLEATLGQLVNSPLITDNISIEPTNIFINTLEIDYQEVLEDTVINGDCDVYQYYLKYKETILQLLIVQDMQLLPYLRSFNVGLNGRVTTTFLDINNIGNFQSTPILLMTYEDDGQFDNRGGFMEALEAGYGEDGTGIGSDMNFQVNVGWSSGNNDVKDIEFPNDLVNAKFRVELQGSSTKMYRVKNFNLMLENTTGTEQDDVYVYSPNFQNNNPSTFLPETEFTLKADVVDSSHSNNTSCGKFINTVCGKFADHISDLGYYSDYIKNCLDGFPILLFLCHVTTDKVTLEKLRTYYYLGVYNMNLGRSSYYNLGYKDLQIFGRKDKGLLLDAGNSFTFFKIPFHLNALRLGLGVAEIQGGDNYFDFSQYDPSVLFQMLESDTRYMFGDIVYGSNGTLEELKSSISKFVEKVAKSGGYLFDYLKKSRGPYLDGYNASIIKEDGTEESKNQIPDYTTLYKKELYPSGKWDFVVKETIQPGSRLDLLNLIIPDIDLGRVASLNFLSTSEYYTICMVLGLVDSVMKNLNIKTWNNKQDGTATWFPAFYDMDTCLGINNQGNDITYFAFSDYYASNILESDSTSETPSYVNIYRDYSPHSLGENGYDVPTNFLFTVAKYAKIIFSDDNSELSEYIKEFPQELYARWRSNVTNNKTHEGILRNADTFMENFFSNNLGNIAAVLVSYNYRSKYMKIANELDIQWVATDFNKYNGTRINKVRDWLNGRLHILDLYFGLNRSVREVINYRTLEGEWKPVKEGSANVIIPTYKQNYDLSNNNDILILKDIFSPESGQGIQLAGLSLFQIKCPEYSPLLLYNAIGSINITYILGGNKLQNIKFQTVGVLNVKLGGSQNWSYLSNINWISTSSLYIISNKLENIEGTSGKFTSLLLQTPNVKTIVLTSQNYSGILQLNESSNYPNLSSINISNSRISLSVNNLNVYNIILNNMNAPQANVSIRNCTLLKLLGLNNLRLLSLSLENIAGEVKVISLTNCNISTISCSAGYKGGIFSLSNDATVELVSVGNFKSIRINNCPKLKKIIITRSEIQDVEDLQIINLSHKQLSIADNVNLDTIVSLTNTKLKTIKIANCPAITKIQLPPNVSVYPEGFKELINLLYLDGENISVQYSSFYSCTKFNLRQSNGQYSDIRISPTLTSLSSIFYSTSIDLPTFIHIINLIPEDNNITDISYMFYNCDITYTLDDYKQDRVNPRIKFELLKKVTNCYQFINMNNIMCIPYNFFKIGSNSSGCNYSNNFSNQNHLYFYPIREYVLNIVGFPFNDLVNFSNRIHPISKDGTILNEFKLADYITDLNGEGPNKLVHLFNFKFALGIVINLENLFDKGWNKLETILNFILGDKVKGLSNLFLNQKRPIAIKYSFNAILDEPCDYYSMFNWDILLNQSAPFYTSDASKHNNVEMNFPKFISITNYYKIIDIVSRNTKITDISNLFRDTTIIGVMPDFKFGSVLNSNITTGYRTFYNVKVKESLDSEIELYLHLSPDFFEYIPNMTILYYFFKNCKFDKPIPFNFFKKRKVNTSKVYVLEGSEYIQGTKYEYYYLQNMTDLGGLFNECTFTEDCANFNPALYTMEDNRVEANGKIYNTYYIKLQLPNLEPVYIAYNINSRTEITDLNVTGGYVGSYQTIKNPVVVGNINRLIIPPDLFYAVKVNGIISKALCCKDKTLHGIIPTNVLSNNRLAAADSLFSLLIIIPLLVHTYTIDNFVHNVYCHVPKRYTDNSYLYNYFDFYPIFLTSYTENNVTIVNHSVVLLQDSINKETSNIQNLCTVERYGIVTNLMPIYLNFMARIVNGQLESGFDISYFKNLYNDGLYASQLFSILSDNLYTANVDVVNLKMQSDTSTIMVGSNANYISDNIILPKASGSVKKLAGNLGYIIKSSNLVNALSSKPWYEQSGWKVID